MQSNMQNPYATRIGRTAQNTNLLSGAGSHFPRRTLSPLPLSFLFVVIVAAAAGIWEVLLLRYELADVVILGEPSPVVADKRCIFLYDLDDGYTGQKTTQKTGINLDHNTSSPSRQEGDAVSVTQLLTTNTFCSSNHSSSRLRPALCCHGRLKKSKKYQYHTTRSVAP